jgi:hypothetical protein
VKNVIAEECGDDIATVADGLADLVQEFCKDLISPEETTTPSYVKRHARGKKDEVKVDRSL